LMHWVHAASEHAPAAMHNEAIAEYGDTELRQMVTVLDRQLEGRDHLLGDAFTLVDLIVAGCVGYGVICGYAADGYPNVKAWLDRCQKRPSFEREWT
jgi:glutathione S-transferase